jgi:hypothetical protein
VPSVDVDRFRVCSVGWTISLLIEGNAGPLEAYPVELIYGVCGPSLFFVPSLLAFAMHASMIAVPGQLVKEASRRGQSRRRIGMRSR